MDTATVNDKPRPVGRPRRLTLEAVIEAACDVGLAKLDMALVAERLNTRVGTLYGYVKGRDELERLVLQRLASAGTVCREATNWQDLLRSHARMSFETCAALPHLLADLLEGEPNEHESAYATEIIAKMVSYGLSDRDSAALYVEVTQAVIGAAVCRARTMKMTGGDAELAGDVSKTLGDFRPTTERIIRDFERSRSKAHGRSKTS